MCMRLCLALLLLLGALSVSIAATILDNPPDPHVGESSDFASQFYKLHRDGKVADKLNIAHDDLPDAVQKRITTGTFADLPGLLQRALLWDSGYVRDGSSLRLVQIYPKCGQDMKTIAVNEGKYRRQTCTFNPECADSHRNGFCNETLIAPISWCAAEGVTGPTDSAMWALHGVLPDHMPEPNIRNHNWTELDLHNQVFAIHSVMDEVSYDKCPRPKDTGVIIPCVVLNRRRSTTGFCNVTEDNYSELVNAWLADPAGRVIKPPKKPFNHILLAPIGGGAVLLIAIVVCCICRCRKKRRKLDSTLREPWLQSPFYQVPCSDRWTAHTATTRGTRSVPRGSDVEFSYPAMERMLTDDPTVGPSRVPMEDIEMEVPLSRGAYGEVWRCKWKGTTVAAKRLLGHRNELLPEISSFVQEILLTAALDHPNIIGFVGVAWTTLDDLCMAIEFLPQGDLQHFMIDNWDMLTWISNKLPMALGVARAMQYLHSLSPMVLHRDIKAKNVLLTDTLDVKLIDFGVSRDIIEETMTAGVGTPYWAAPEVLEGQRYSEKSDIYSFGVLLSELANGDTPYKNLRSQTTGEPLKALHILSLVMAGKLRPSFPPDCPLRIVQLALRCLDQNAFKRPTATEIVEILQGQQGRRGASLGPKERRMSAPTGIPTSPPPRPRKTSNLERIPANLSLD